MSAIYLIGVLVIALRSFSAPLGVSSGEEQCLRAAIPLIQAGALADAEAKLLEGLRQYPKSPILNNALGIVYERQNKIGAAVQAFERAIDELPSFTAAQIHLATIYADVGRCDLVQSLSLRASAATSDAHALDAVGLALAKCKDFGNAVQVLEKANRVDPSSASIGYNLALAEYNLGEFAKALDVLSRVPEELDAGNADVLYLRGKSLEALNRPGSAEYLAKSCQFQVQEVFCEDAAAELIRENNFLQAARLIQSSLPKIPDSAALTCTLALAEFELGRYEDATRDYTQVIERDPKLDAAWEGLTFLYYMTGDLDKAEATTQRALQRPESDAYLSYLAALVIYRKSRDRWQETLTNIQTALKKNPRFAPAYYLRGKVRMDRSDLTSALADFEKAAQLDPEFALPLYKIAQIYRRQGKEDQALRTEQRFRELGSMREEEMLQKQAQNLLVESIR